MDENSDTLEMFRILFKAYEISKGFQRQPIYIQVIAERMGIDINDNIKYPNLIELVVQLENKGLLAERPHLTITISGINEIESAIIEPDKPTRYFSANITKFVSFDVSLVEQIRTLRKSRRDYLHIVYQIAQGKETAIVNPYEAQKKLGIEQEILKKVYYYLEDEGLIRYIDSDSISLTHNGKLEIEMKNISQIKNPSFWHSAYPDVTITDEIVIVIDRINVQSLLIFGFEIFRNRAGPITELRLAIKNLNNDSTNKDAFITCLLSIATVLGEINIHELKKIVTTENIKGLKVIEELFLAKGIKYDESNFIMLRKVVRIRSTIPPVHSAETEYSEALQYVGIQYPVIDWAEAADVCLKQVLKSLKGLLHNLSLN